ncbi:hypothetical protein [Paenibacillus xanthanilyticus]|uniref:Uncharacterized protein n=1 Tax=Paenibacillus xanthanilyticus TaxID=1783531 RepID=A0ABV8K2E1_9BACL
MPKDKEPQSRLPQLIANPITELTASHFGLLYEATSGPITMTGNSYLGIMLRNPSASERCVYLSRILYGAVANTSFTLIRNGKFAGGDPLTPYNANFGADADSEAKLKLIAQASDPFEEDEPFSTVIPSGGSLVEDWNGRIILPPKSSLGVRIANNTAQPSLVALTISWWELGSSQ